MGYESLKIYGRPKLESARMVMAFSGWMDGGDTSTGTVRYLAEKLHAKKTAEIEPEAFYIYNFPGSMEVSSLFRPHTKIEDGLVAIYQEPTNTFFCSEQHNLVLFSGKEPNIRWNEYAECVLSLAADYSVAVIYFVGSVAGLVPHTRDPRWHGSISTDRLRRVLQQHDMKPTNYEGPASIVTYLTVLAREKGIRMATLVAEIPAYVQGENVKCIEAAARKLSDILELAIDLGDLKERSQRFEKTLNETLLEKPDLAEHIKKLEDDYDREVRDEEVADLKSWFEKQGIHLE
jgi:proteasome assembly chaperone (PAC2) family protein